MNNELNDLLKEIMGDFEKSEAFIKDKEMAKIVIDSKHCEIVGSTPRLLALYTQLTKCLLEDAKNINKSDLERAQKLAFMNDKEFEKETLENLKNLLSKMAEVILDDDEEDDE